MSDDEVYYFTEKGLRIAWDMEDKFREGWDIEAIAAYYDLEPLDVRVVMTMLSMAEDNRG